MGVEEPAVDGWRWTRRPRRGDRVGRGRRRWWPGSGGATLLVTASAVVALAAGCAAGDVVAGRAATGTDGPAAGTDPAPRCEQPPVMGNGDAFSYPATLDELVADADVVVDARIVGESGPVVHDGGWQPMAVDVVEVLRGDAEDRLTVMRAQTTSRVTGTADTQVGSWDLEPWYCPGERYVLFLDRLPEGGYQALTRQGALRTEPPPAGRAPTELVASLRELPPDALRAEVRAAAARVGG